MKEIFQITDKLVILKDGKLVTTLKTSETNSESIINLMVGRPLGDVFNELERNNTPGRVLLEVRNLDCGFLRGISFLVRAGEILGFAGLVGAGRTETMRTVFGADKMQKGEIIIKGKGKVFSHPAEAIACGIALCPEDRKDEGIIKNRSVKENLTVSILHKLIRMGFINKAEEKRITEESIAHLHIRTPSMNKNIVELSGGNQQKVIFARSLATNPEILILDEPTKGIDVGAKSEIYKIICGLARKGIGIVIISSELPEILGLCDRIIVMSKGKITGESCGTKQRKIKFLLMPWREYREKKWIQRTSQADT
jgi:ABC-type sugar transport system ATPase subunit